MVEETPEDEVDRKIRAAAQWLVNEFSKASFMERFRIVLDVILAAVAISALVIYGGQLHQMRTANELTKEAIHASERAWVGVKNVNPDSFERGAGSIHRTRCRGTASFRRNDPSAIRPRKAKRWRSSVEFTRQCSIRNMAGKQLRLRRLPSRSLVQTLSPNKRTCEAWWGCASYRSVSIRRIKDARNRD
jgi:hypothetical protein